MGTVTAPRVGIGATLYNRAAYLPEALDSLLAQSLASFRLVLVDDGSVDETGQIAAAYATRDPRVSYVRNERRLGMVGAWRRAFELATEPPSVEYFAWASDHDRWHPEWLARLTAVLDRDHDIVLAYPLTQRIDPAGALLAKPARYFDTTALTDLEARWLAMSRSRSVAAGDMVYGLMRASAVRQAGIFRDVRSPDRLLMAELTIRGRIHQLPEVLWYRRQFEGGSVARQKHTLFAEGARPGNWHLPVWLQHARVLWSTYGVDGGPLAPTRPAARKLVARYTLAYAWRHHRKTTVHRWFNRTVEFLGHLYRVAKHYVLLAVFYSLVYGRRAFWGSVYYVLVAFRRIGITPAVERMYERLTR